MRLDIKAAGAVPKAATEYFRKKKLAPELDLDETWVEEHGFAVEAVRTTDEDLMSDLQRAVDLAIEKGLTFREFADRIDEVVTALGWAKSGKGPPRRLKTIYETNMRVARAAGQWARIQRTAEARPFLEYSLGPAVKHRPEHESWAGTILPASDAWWSSHFPPNGFGCKCRVRQLSTAEAERKGISEAAPAGDPDPGWSYNPGVSRGA